MRATTWRFEANARRLTNVIANCCQKPAPEHLRHETPLAMSTIASFNAPSLFLLVVLVLVRVLASLLALVLPRRSSSPSPSVNDATTASWTVTKRVGQLQARHASVKYDTKKGFGDAHNISLHSRSIPMLLHFGGEATALQGQTVSCT
jgi:hypothetical protein